jgi:hypothetical protein
VHGHLDLPRHLVQRLAPDHAQHDLGLALRAPPLG